MEIIETYSYSGDLRKGYFFELYDIPLGMERDFVSEMHNPEAIIRLLPENEGNHSVYCDAFGDWQFVHNCKRYQSHGYSYLTNLRTDIFGGDYVPKMIAAGSLAILINKDFRGDLLKSNLVGYSTMLLPIVANQSKLKYPEIYHLEFLGKECHQKREVHIPADNRCPFCGWEPVVCPECFDIKYECPSCKKITTEVSKKHGGVGDKRFIITGGPPEGWVIEGNEWDGSDFISMPTHICPFIISGRALDFLISVKAFPFVAKPCFVDVSGCDEEKRKTIDAIQYTGTAGH